ncbi:DUF1624 domain-containing protein [Candidatus Bathyarchaeota archaeon]|nr:DUF1624 domain-containing protein [Candidatus Bathyarchaeota archaeon]
MQSTQKPSSSRLHFIDFTRGLVMMLMAWDHVSMFWMEIHGGGESPYMYPFRNPDLGSALFLSRFITHWCAPTFVFLSGNSLALSVNNRLNRGDSEQTITLHIIKRGLVLLLFEALVVSPAFDFPRYYFGVIAAIGVSLIIFSVARRLPPAVILAASLFTVLNQQWFNHSFIPMDVAWGHYLTRVLFEPGFTWYPYFSLYTVIPWVGVMGLGWVFGALLHNRERGSITKLKLPLAAAGVSSIALFFMVRLFNGYGNLIRRWSNNVLDWLYVSKYPPSVAFLLWTLGGTCIFMAAGIFVTERGWTERGVSGAIHTFGRGPLFFYLTHLWLYRLRLSMVEAPFHLGLLSTIGFWLVGLVVLWGFCARYEVLKKGYPRLLQYI